MGAYAVGAGVAMVAEATPYNYSNRSFVAAQGFTRVSDASAFSISGTPISQLQIIADGLSNPSTATINVFHDLVLVIGADGTASVVR